MPGTRTNTAAAYRRYATRTFSQSLRMPFPMTKAPLAAATLSSTFVSDFEGAPYLATTREQYAKKSTWRAPRVEKPLPVGHSRILTVAGC